MRHGLGVVSAAVLAGFLAGCSGFSMDFADGYAAAYRPATARDRQQSSAVALHQPAPATPVQPAASPAPPPIRPQAAGGAPAQWPGVACVLSLTPPVAAMTDMDKPIGSDVAPSVAQAGPAPAAGPPFALAAQAPKGQEPSAASPAPASQPAGGKKYVEWRTRRGPAYENDFWTSFGRDAKEMPDTLWDDTKASFTNPWCLAGLAAAGISGGIIAGTDADDKVEHHFTKHWHQLNSFWDTVGDAGGNPGTHFIVAGTMYFTGLGTKDVKTYETSKALLNGLIITDLLTVGLKTAFNTRSPNGDEWGWPSGHASSSFCLATVLGEAYGPWVGVPLFLGASYVGYERVDARNHDFSDVVSGAFIGMAIGHAVMQNHKPKVFGFEVVPFANPNNGAVGVALTRRF